MSHYLIIQLARLGDLLQSFPAFISLKSFFPHGQFDLLCAAPLVPVGNSFPGIGQVFPWDGKEWSVIAQNWSFEREKSIYRAADHLKSYQMTPYVMAYNLNNHSRAILAAHLCAKQVVGPGCDGPLAPTRPNWVRYLHMVGTHRGNNRVHLADAFCGMCGVQPPSFIPRLEIAEETILPSVSGFFRTQGVRVAIILGTGDTDRRIPLRVWERWIRAFFSTCPEGRVILVGGIGERELTHALMDRMPSIYQSRIWDSSGKTSLLQLANIFSSCDWVIGSDTGPLHLGAACGAKVQGIYFSRARVHETGPYGQGHWVWQAEQPRERHEECNEENNGVARISPDHWPVRESVELLLTGTCTGAPEGWSLWRSEKDEWGVHFLQYPSYQRKPSAYREQIWQQLFEHEDVDWDSVLEVMRNAEYSALSKGER